jgi:hypothetical protein
MKSALVLIFVFTLFIGRSFSQVNGDYRTVGSGTWSTPGIWETFSAGSWGPAGVSPSSANNIIQIRTGNTVTITTAVTIDQVVIDIGGQITWTGSTCVIADGPGVDLQIDGTFWDNRSAAGASISFSPATATWQMGANGTLIRSVNNSSANWQNSYQGGIFNIPSTSNWIIRKVGGQNPSITTTAAFYGNLIIENNNTTTWHAPVATSTFQGGGLTTIKGNLDIGGTGTNLVSFVSQITGSPTLILGNIIVRPGCNLKNYGSGIELQGNLDIQTNVAVGRGILSYDGNGSRTLLFSGGNNQQITNNGDLAIYNMTVNKTAGTTVTLNTPIIVDNILTLTNGIINTTSTNLLNLWYNSSSAGGSNTSYINGPVRYWGMNGMSFNTGKSGNWLPIAISNTVAGANIFSENWSGGAGTWTLNVVTGTEGADPNYFEVDANEGGVTPNLGSPGSCGAANNGNSTLNLTSVFNPAGGAAYDAGGLCGLLYCPQADRRTESPTLNCTGRTNIYVQFDYIENGDGLNDNATLQYFDGSVWTTIDDMRKTPTGCAGGQGQWTTRIVFLPASANNNANVKIAFRWVNNDDGVGTDPSFAVDNIIVNANDAFTAEYFQTNPQIPYGNILAPTLTALSDCEYWILDRLGSNNNRNVTLTWNAASCYNTAFASFEVARHDGISTWQDHDGIVAGTAAGGTVTTPAVVTSFSPFALAYVPLPLPIELLKFDAVCDNGKVKLYWQTSSEINNEYFTIEKSSDMIVWEEVRKIDGAGNSNVVLSYESYDPTPGGENYYRLRQTDYNGQTVTFDPVFVKCSGSQNGINIYPNPTTGILNIDIPVGSVMQSIEVINSLGQPVLNIITGDVKGGVIHPVDLSLLQAGTYYLRILVDGVYTTKPVNLIR